MTTLPSRAQITDALADGPTMAPRFGDLRDFVAQLPGAQADTELTIAAGAVTPTRFLHRVDTEADAAADNLDNILQDNLPDGSLLKLVPENAARVVTLRHQIGGAGELVLTNGENFALDDAGKWIKLRRKGTQWIEIYRSSVFGRRVGAAADAAALRTLAGLGTAATQNTGTSGAVVPLLNAANTFGADQTVQLTDNGAGEGPTVTLFRDTASPAASDLLGVLRWLMRDSGANADAALKILGEIVDPTATSEDARLLFQSIIAGTLATRMTLQNGLFMAGATGGDQGAGTINATNFFKNGVALGNISIALVRDEKSNGTNAQGSTGSGTYDKRDLNTEAFDPDGIVSLASNEFTLQAGTYLIFADCSAKMENIFYARHKLRNVTDATDVIVGVTGAAGASNGSGTVYTTLRARVSIADAKAFAIYSAASVNSGYGVHDNMALGNEVYNQILIMKLP